MKVILLTYREDHLSVLPLQMEPLLMCPLGDPVWVRHPSAVLLLPPPWPRKIRQCNQIMFRRDHNSAVFALGSRQSTGKVLISPSISWLRHKIHGEF